MKKKKLDAEAILRQLAAIRKSIPRLPVTPAQPASDGRVVDAYAIDEEDFAYAAVAEGLSSLAADISAAVDAARAAATAKALEIYYRAEELARDPQHADLIPHVERMRAAYESEHGRAIPKKGGGPA